MARGIIRTGIGGWDYDPWRDYFYPKGLAKARRLAWAAERLTAIEINATYYRSQKPETFAKWAAAVPDGFRFSLKASRYATARKVLAGSGESVAFFLNQGFTALGDRLGPILWQLADGKPFDREDFARFIDLLPEKQDGVALRHAIEVRHESFSDAAFVTLARERNMAIVFADDDNFPCIDEATADFAYARLRRSQPDCATGYDGLALDRLATAAKKWAARGDAYVYFISGAKERNPAAAMALIERLR